MGTGKLDVYNMGEVGVDLVESPLHKKDGAFLSAQNCVHLPVESEGGIIKRMGMSKLNATTAASGQIYAISIVRQVDPNPSDVT